MKKDFGNALAKWYISETSDNQWNEMNENETRISGPPKAGNTNLHKTLIILKSILGENMDFRVSRFFKYKNSKIKNNIREIIHIIK